MRDTVNQAYGRWGSILPAMGIDSKYLRNIHGPCPICGGKDRFRYDDKGNGEWFCSHCTKKGERPDGFTLLQTLNRWDFKRAADEVDRILGLEDLPQVQAQPERTEEDKRAFMKRLWKESRPVAQGDPVWLYLERRCGDPTGFLQDIRFHPSLKHSLDGGCHPAMLSMMGWDGARYSGIHRTYLTEGGHKAQVDPVRMTYGDVGHVRLGPILEHMGIAEGIETAICAGKRFGLPVWSGISANGLIAWEPPADVKAVSIFGDNDKNYTGQAAAFALAKRLSLAGLEVQVHIPELPGTDWADQVFQEVA